VEWHKGTSNCGAGFDNFVKYDYDRESRGYLLVKAARLAGLGSGGKGAENSSPGPPFSATFSQVQRLRRFSGDVFEIMRH
jgi:hypothetical protein